MNIKEITINEKTIVWVFDWDWKLFAVLVNNKFEKQFNKDFLNNFSDILPYVWLYGNEYNLELFDFITKYEFYE